MDYIILNRGDDNPEILMLTTDGTYVEIAMALGKVNLTKIITLVERANG